MLTMVTALALIGVGEARGQDAAEKAAEQDGRIQQYVQMLQPAMWKELDFVRQICDLKPEQRPKIKAAGEAATKQAARNMVNPQLVRGQRPNTQFTAGQIIREGLTKALQETLSAEDLARFNDEVAKRVAAHKQATITNVVGQLDGVLYLNKEQREKITANLDINWQPDWEQWLMVRQYGGEYFPTVPDQQVVPHLNSEQVSVWRGLQKVSFNSWGGQNRRPQDAWWEGKPDNAAKAKTKAKAKAAQAAP
jgi:hypothetical protein